MGLSTRDIPYPGLVPRLSGCFSLDIPVQFHPESPVDKLSGWNSTGQ
jgi:hypothetical protein